MNIINKISKVPLYLQIIFALILAVILSIILVDNNVIQLIIVFLSFAIVLRGLKTKCIQENKTEVGSNFNNDGTALYEAMSAIFIRQKIMDNNNNYDFVLTIFC